MSIGSEIKKFCFAIIAVIFTCTLFATFLYALPVIDDFGGTDQIVMPTGASPTKTSSLAYGSALGGYRDIYAQLTHGVYLIGGTAALPNENFLTIQLPTLSEGDFAIIYDGDNNASSIDFDGLGGIDLTIGSTATELQVSVQSFDAAGVALAEFGCVVYDASSATGLKHSSYYLTLNASIDYGYLTLPFASFTPTGSAGGASFTNVGAIFCSFSGYQNQNHYQYQLHHNHTDLLLFC